MCDFSYETKLRRQAGWQAGRCLGRAWETDTSFVCMFVCLGRKEESTYTNEQTMKGVLQ